jgi:hypothetical protein
VKGRWKEGRRRRRRRRREKGEGGGRKNQKNVLKLGVLHELHHVVGVPDSVGDGPRQNFLGHLG